MCAFGTLNSPLKSAFETTGRVLYQLLYIIDMSRQNQPSKRSEVTQTKDSGGSWSLILTNTSDHA
jgi:hypothetical protein